MELNDLDRELMLARQEAYQAEQELNRLRRNVEAASVEAKRSAEWLTVLMRCPPGWELKEMGSGGKMPGYSHLAPERLRAADHPLSALFQHPWAQPPQWQQPPKGSR